jgi:hypothetical protein
VSFTCECGCHFFSGSVIQGGMYLDVSWWSLIRCLECEKKYLYNPELGFKHFDAELVK